MFKKRTHQQEEVHKHLVERAKTATTTSATTVPAGTTTTTEAGGQVITIVIEVSTAGANASATLNGTLSANSTSTTSTSLTTSTVPPTTTMSSIVPLNTTVPATDDSSVGHTGLSTGGVAGISVASTVGGLALLGLIAYLFRRRANARNQDSLDMMMGNSASAFPDPYQQRFSGAGNMPAQARYEAMDDEDDGPEGEMSQVSRRRSARSYPGSPF